MQAGTEQAGCAIHLPCLPRRPVGGLTWRIWKGSKLSMAPMLCFTYHSSSAQASQASIMRPPKVARSCFARLPLPFLSPFLLAHVLTTCWGSKWGREEGREGGRGVGGQPGQAGQQSWQPEPEEERGRLSRPGRERRPGAELHTCWCASGAAAASAQARWLAAHLGIVPAAATHLPEGGGDEDERVHAAGRQAACEVR